jgi:hypothetical protein
MVLKRALQCAVAALAIAPGVIRAQTSQGCFWPGPAPRCGSWFITEAGLFARFTDRHPGDENLLIGYSFGWMRNAGAHSSWGAELFGGTEGEVRGGFGVRARRWLSPRAAVDVAAGVHLFGDASSQDVASGSPMFAVRITHADKFAAAMRLDVLRLRCGATCSPTSVPNPNGTSARLYIGAEAGSQFGLIGAGLTAVVVGLWALSCCD